MCQQSSASAADPAVLTTIDLEAGESSKLNESSKGMLVAFDKLAYAVADQRNTSEKKVLVNKISGCFEPGRMAALIGPSGSGKSTLLDVLSGRKTAGTIEGKITYNSMVPDAHMLKNSVGYVEQFETLLPELTVREMLSYTATFKLKHLTSSQISKKVDKVLKTLQLEECQHTIIGDKMHRGVSGGQAKRVNIGLALLTSPSVIFLDEPTSGLDSTTADSVIECLRKLADEGHTIVVTIHSPSSYAFSLFDTLTLLKEGHLVYQGEAAHAKRFFQDQGCEPASGTAELSLVEWIVETVTKGRTAAEFHGAYGKSPLCAENDRRMHDLVALAKPDPSHSSGSSSNSIATPTKYKSNGLWNLPHATWTLLRFRGSRHLRSVNFLAPRMAGPIFFALILWSLFAGVGKQAATDRIAAQSVSGLMFVTVVLCGYGASSFVPSMAMDRAIFYRDRSDGYYGSLAYALAKFIEDLITMFVTAVLCSVIVFYGCSLQGSFWVFLGVRFLSSMVGVTLAYWSAAVSPTVAFACALLPIVVTVCQFMSGFVIIYQSIPAGWIWFYRINFIQYGFTALVTNQFSDAAGQGTNPIAAEQLKMYSLMGDELALQPGFCIGMLAITMVVTLLLTVVTLSVVKHGSR